MKKITTQSVNCVVIFVCYGGDKEDRTPDLLHAKQALSQLSYTPKAGLLKIPDSVLHSNANIEMFQLLFQAKK
jgi:hypothetical protein